MLIRLCRFFISRLWWKLVGFKHRCHTLGDVCGPQRARCWKFGRSRKVGNGIAASKMGGISVTALTAVYPVFYAKVLAHAEFPPLLTLCEEL